MARIKRGCLLIGIEKIRRHLDDVYKLVDELLENDCPVKIVSRPGKAIVSFSGSDEPVNLVVGRGSLVIPGFCGKLIEKYGIPIYRISRDEWIDTCNLSSEKYFDVSIAENQEYGEEGWATTFTTRMIYPFIVNGVHFYHAIILETEDGDEAIVGINGEPEKPLIVLREDTILVSPTLQWLTKLLSIESRCSDYKFLKRRN